MTLDINKLEAAAKAATQGEWVVSDYIYAADGKRVANYHVLSRDDVDNYNNGHYIATANPQAVLELIARLREAEKDAARLDWLIKNEDRALSLFEHIGATYWRKEIDMFMKESA